MNLPKLLGCVALILFGLIGVAAFLKKPTSNLSSESLVQVPIEIVIEEKTQSYTPAPSPPSIPVLPPPVVPLAVIAKTELPDDDRIEQLFNLSDPRLPIVETITYKSHVSWLKGRPAWLADYASHYSTSRHFIARSLNKKVDYFKQDIAEGDSFNVFRQGKNFEFHLIVDTSRCRLWFYYKDLDLNEFVLLKTYSVCLGRLDASKSSGLLTPLGKYTLGDRIAVYKPKMTGIHQGKKVEMVSVFGTRWIPFDKEIGFCTESAKGFGLHGTPCLSVSESDSSSICSSIGKYESDGCIRLSTQDMEELYAIIITKPTIIEIVPDFYASSILENQTN